MLLVFNIFYNLSKILFRHNSLLFCNKYARFVCTNLDFMHKIIVLFLFVFCSCNITNNLPTQKLTICPSDGDCTVTILEHKTMVLITNVDNSTSYTLHDDSTHTVIRYEFKKNMNQAATDGSYKETLVFEINNNTSQTLENGDLQKTKMLFGRYCFCRGQIGLFKVNKGKLEWHKENKKLNFHLNFSINEVPQIITVIEY